jgi:hypothetical protein
MKRMRNGIEVKICLNCCRDLPLEAFNRYSKSRDGRQPVCRECAKVRNRDHYIKYTESEEINKGFIGVRCILYARLCKVCYAVEECWRLESVATVDGAMPVCLVGENIQGKLGGLEDKSLSGKSLFADYQKRTIGRKVYDKATSSNNQP